MDEHVKQSINARKDAIFNTYKVDGAMKKKVNELFSEIEKLGLEAKDVSGFETKFAKSPLNQKYTDLFTEVAMNCPLGGSLSQANKSQIGKAMSGAATESIADRAIREVAPTRASVHQAAYDAANRMPVIGNMIDIGQKAGYAMHLKKVFGKKKKDK